MVLIYLGLLLVTRRTWKSGTNLPGTVARYKNRKVVLIYLRLLLVTRRTWKSGTILIIYLGLLLATRRTWKSGTNLPGTVASDKKNMKKWC